MIFVKETLENPVVRKEVRGKVKGQNQRDLRYTRYSVMRTRMRTYASHSTESAAEVKK
jgi:hypothetical protein